jgi:transposase
MGERRRAADRAGRTAMRSPGRPPVGRLEHRQRFWAAITRGLSSEDAAVRAGVSAAVGVRWFREGGGMPSVTLAPASGRYLSFAEREEIAILRARGAGVRQIARQLGRSPSTISRELRRNAATRGGGLEYRATTAQWHADMRARRPKPAKLAAVERAQLPAFTAFADGVRLWRAELLAYFDEPTTNGYAEGVINKVKVIKRRAYRLPSFDGFRDRVLLACA